MACTVFQGRHFDLIGQIEPVEYAVAPITPDALRLKFNTVSLNRNPMRNQDPTIKNRVLLDKSDEIDESPEGSITAISCLNDALFWFTHLFGPPSTVGAATSAAKAGGNTGNGVLGTVTVTTPAKSGVYQLRITAAAANAGTFTLTGPTGVSVGTGTVAVAFAVGGFSFTLADGSTDFIVGDGYDITVALYEHTFTLTADCKPSSLIELVGIDPDDANLRVYRYLGMMLKDFSWDLLNADQNWTANVTMARRVMPIPTTRFDTTPSSNVKARCLAAKGKVEDVDGASTLGMVSGATFAINLNPQPTKLADGLFGYGTVLPGQIEITGGISVLFEDGGTADYAESFTTIPLILTTEAETGESCVITLPSVELDEPAISIETTQGIVRSYNYKAHNVDADAPVTIVLTNASPALLTA